MKNLNPKSGLKQISSGKLYLPRRFVLELIKNKRITVNQLGYYILAHISTDWTDEEYRYGFIRHETKQLSKIFNISYSTLNDNLNKLVEAGLITKRQDVLSINDFIHFQKAGGKYSNKNVTTDEELELIFKDLLQESENSDSNQIESTKSLKIPHKVEHKVVSKGVYERTNADYQRIYVEGNYSGFLPDDMRWLDDHYDANGRFIP